MIPDALFDIIDALLNPNASDGLSSILNRNKYLLVKDEAGKLICFSYAKNSLYKEIIEEYLIQEGYDKKACAFEENDIKKEELEKIIDYKLVALDKKLVLYGEVKEKAEEFAIDGYDGKLPKHGMNVYKLISKDK